MNANIPQTSKNIFVENVVASYLHVTQPKVKTDPITKATRSTYEVDGVFAHTNPAFELVKQTMREVAKAAWGEALNKFPLGPVNAAGQATLVEMPNWQGILTVLANEGKTPLRDGNKRKKLEAPYEGNFYLAARNSKRQPNVVVTRLNGSTGKLENVSIQPGDPQYPTSGDHVTLGVEIWAQDTLAKPSPYGKRINCTFTGIQFLKQGERRFVGGGRVNAAEEFGLNSTDADAEAPGSAVGTNGVSLI